LRARWRAGLNSDRYDEENQRELVHPVLLLAEGKSDASFLMRLFAERGVGELHFGFPTDATGGPGISGLGRHLSSLPVRPGFRRLRAALVFYDNDADPAARFVAVRNLVETTDPYSVPATPMDLGAPHADAVRLMFVPMPGVHVPGALETLLLQSATAEAAALACVDDLAVCTACCADWSPSHVAKMRLRCLIAVKCEGKSDMTLTHIWGKAGNPIDLNHACFNGLVETVRAVAASV
jgi:hypothetical protein